MTSRERVISSLSHREPDKVPLDLGSTLITGIHVSSLHKLKVALGLIKPEEPVKVIDPFQMLGEVDDELRKVLGIDTVPLLSLYNFLDLRMKTGSLGLSLMAPLLVPEKFNTTPDSEGNIYQYPGGIVLFLPQLKCPGAVFTTMLLSGKSPSERKS